MACVAESVNCQAGRPQRCESSCRDDDRVLGGEHELGAVGDAPLHGAHHRLRVDPAERALVADVGVQKADARRRR